MRSNLGEAAMPQIEGKARVGPKRSAGGERHLFASRRLARRGREGENGSLFSEGYPCPTWGGNSRSGRREPPDPRERFCRVFRGIDPRQSPQRSHAGLGGRCVPE